MKDPRNPKRIVIKKMEEFSFYKDTEGKTPIARNCHYAYVGAVGGSKYYPEYKTAVWDLFELEKDESKDPACNQFKYLSIQAPDGEPIHTHFHYSQQSMNDPRNPKRIALEKMEKFTLYKDAAGKAAIARDCRYAYLGAVPDSKYYPEYKTAVWDVFELEKDENEKQDPACNQFKYLSFQAPHGDPSHMHFRYGSDKSSLQALINMSTDPEDKAKFNPWWSAYCGGGKTACGKDE